VKYRQLLHIFLGGDYLAQRNFNREILKEKRIQFHVSQNKLAIACGYRGNISIRLNQACLVRLKRQWLTFLDNLTVLILNYH
jgi:hypothetical protein